MSNKLVSNKLVSMSDELVSNKLVSNRFKLNVVSSFIPSQFGFQHIFFCFVFVLNFLFQFFHQEANSNIFTRFIFFQAQIYESFADLNSSQARPTGSVGFVEDTSTLYVLTVGGWVAVQVHMHSIYIERMTRE